MSTPRLSRRTRAALSTTIALLSAWLCLVPLGCGRGPSPSGGKPVVFVSLLPQADIVRRVAGGAVEVEAMIGRGQAEHQYEPTPQQILRLQNARAYFTVGVGAETRLVDQIRRAYPGVPIVDSRRGVPLRKLTDQESAACTEDHDHAHDHDHEHAAGAPDPHVWLDPALLKIQARNVAEELTKILPDQKEQFEKNLAEFEAELDALDAEIDELMRPFEGRTLLVFHPTLGYFADRYRLVQRAIEVEGKEPSPRQIESIVTEARKLGVGAVFYQPQFPRRSADVIADAIHGRAVELDHLPENIIEGLRDLARKIAEALRQSPASKPSAPKE